MANDDDHDRAIDIHSFLEQSSALTPSIPATRANVACCCGNEACAYLKHNQSALDGLERDVCTAAQLGKVSLVVSFAAPSLRHRTSLRLAALRQSTVLLRHGRLRRALWPGQLGQDVVADKSCAVKRRSIVADVFIAGAFDAT